jgi:hypothetical protein
MVDDECNRDTAAGYCLQIYSSEAELGCPMIMRILQLNNNHITSLAVAALPTKQLYLPRYTLPTCAVVEPWQAWLHSHNVVACQWQHLQLAFRLVIHTQNVTASSSIQLIPTSQAQTKNVLAVLQRCHLRQQPQTTVHMCWVFPTNLSSVICALVICASFIPTCKAVAQERSHRLDCALSMR